MKQLAAVWCVCLLGLHGAQGFSAGAPPTTCEAMVPKHRDTVPQNGQSLYTVSPSHPNTQDGKVRFSYRVDRLKMVCTVKNNQSLLHSQNL